MFKGLPLAKGPASGESQTAVPSLGRSMVAIGTGAAPVLRGAEGARAAADRLVAKLRRRLEEADRNRLLAEEALATLLGDGEVAARVRCLLPALEALVQGRVPQWLDKLRRNTGLHSALPGAQLLAAGAAGLRAAQRGPRLDSVISSLPDAQPRRVRPSSLSADAQPFVPGAGAHPGGQDAVVDRLLAALDAAVGTGAEQVAGLVGGARALAPRAFPPSDGQLDRDILALEGAVERTRGAFARTAFNGAAENSDHVSGNSDTVVSDQTCISSAEARHGAVAGPSGGSGSAGDGVAADVVETAEFGGAAVQDTEVDEAFMVEEPFDVQEQVQHDIVEMVFADPVVCRSGGTDGSAVEEPSLVLVPTAVPTDVHGFDELAGGAVCTERHDADEDVEVGAEELFPEDTEPLESLSVVQRHLANLVIETGSRARVLLDLMRGGLCPICVSSDLHPRLGPRLSIPCELCHDGIEDPDRMIQCYSCQSAVHTVCLQEQLER